jgi:predicted dehydrogenase
MKKLKMGMIGGGKNAFIGAVHRIAANIDGLIELHCGAFSSNPALSKESGQALFLPEHKCYGSYEEMITTEAQLPPDERMDFVSIVTPNHAHFAPAMMALDYGFHVVLDKPMTLTLEEAKKLAQKVKETGLQLCLTHTYSGYPMVKQAKNLIANNLLGSIRKIMVEYPQGWLSTPFENEGNKQAAWRTDPSKSGISGCMGDIGTHAAHLAEYISGLKITQLRADITTVVPNRRLDDDGNVLLKFDNGANGILVASQIAAGEENSLKIKIYGEKGGLEWHQMEPNTLIVKWLDAPVQIYRTGNGYVSSVAAFNTRIPSGHPEGYLEAFASLYKNFPLTLQAQLEGKKPTLEMPDFPTVSDGVRGMAFIENVITSGRSTQKWTEFKI